jgi:HEAT repeat protein
VTLRFTLATIALAGLVLGGSIVPASAQAPSGGAGLDELIPRLSSLDYPIRTGAARLIRRAPAPEAVAALTAAVRTSSDEFVRYRALILLTGFSDRATPALMRSLLADRNDRVREVAYRWFELHPDPALASQLFAALQTEQAEFVRPALVRALGAMSGDPAVQRALTAEAGRGLDFFRSAVIEVLGLRKATWGLAPVLEAAKVDGPLQDDALLALGRIGDPRALEVIAAVPMRPIEAAVAAQAALCLMGDDCPSRIAWLSDTVTSRIATREAVRSGVAALGALAVTSDPAMAALAALLAHEPVRADVAIGLGGVALRVPERMLPFIDSLAPAERVPVITAIAEAFERFEEDFAEEQFYAAARAAYWAAPEGAATRTLMAALIEELDF